MSDILIHESSRIPITNGTVRINSSDGNLTLKLKKGKVGDSLILKKISTDDNVIYLSYENCIIIFGVPQKARTRLGKVNNIIINFEDGGWEIIGEF